MAAFADIHGSPDAETTARMRERLRTRLADGDRRKRRLWHWVQASLLTLLVLAGAGYGAWTAGWLGSPSAVHAPGVIQTGNKAQELTLEWGTLKLEAHSIVRVETESRSIELVEGTVTIRIEEEGPTLVRVGAHAAEASDGHFEVRRTPGVPLVTVHRGQVVLRGPDLPDAGISMRDATPP